MASLHESLDNINKRMLTLDAGLGPKRISLEKLFFKDMFKALLFWYKEFTDELIGTGVLDLAASQSLRIKSLPYRQRKRTSTEVVNQVFNPFVVNTLGKDYRRSLFKLYRKWFVIFYELGAVHGLRTLGVKATSRKVLDVYKKTTVKKEADELVFNLNDFETSEYIENRELFLGALITLDIIDDARKLVKKDIYMGGKSVTDVALELSKSKDIVYWRALKIVRTEAQQAFSIAMYDVFIKSGIKKHTWYSVGDRRVRPAHQNNDSVTVAIGKPFPSGQLHPGDGPQSINCRCSVLPDILSSSVNLVPWDGSPGVTPSSGLIL